jgi:hypothetical protein
VTGVLQSGSVTPGHLATWVTDNVLGDGGSPLAQQSVIAELLGADFNSTLDQAIVLPADLLAFQLFRIYVTRATLSLTTAVGGFYPQALKAGTALVAASQTYSALTSASVLLSATFTGAVATTRFTRTNLPDWTIYFSLTTPQGIDCSADIYVVGTPLTR